MHRRCLFLDSAVTASKADRLGVAGRCGTVLQRPSRPTGPRVPGTEARRSSRATDAVFASAWMNRSTRGLVGAGSMSIWIRTALGENWAPNAVVNWFRPTSTARTTSACRMSLELASDANPPQTPRSLSRPAKVPRAGAELVVRAPRRSARSPSSATASRAPRPARMRGRWAAARSFALLVTASVFTGTGGGPGRGDSDQVGRKWWWRRQCCG